MRTQLAVALLLLTLPGCKRQTSDVPGHDSSSSRRVAKRSVKPREVCDHLARMVAAEAGMRKAPVDEQLMAECESELTIEAGNRGTDNWNAFAGCVLDSNNATQLEECSRAYPMPGQGGLVASDGSRELAVCEHMIEVLMLESAAQSGEVPQLTSEERDVLEEDCARSLIVEQKPQRSDVAYQEMLECIALAQTSELMRACE